MKTPAQIERRLDGIVDKSIDSTPDTAQSTFSRPLRDIIRDIGNETVESGGQTRTRFELMMQRHGRKLSTNQTAFNFKNRLSTLEQSRGKGETPLHIVVVYVDPDGNDTNEEHRRSEFKHPQSGRPIIVDWPNDSPTHSPC